MKCKSVAGLLFGNDEDKNILGELLIAGNKDVLFSLQKIVQFIIARNRGNGTEVDKLFPQYYYEGLNFIYYGFRYQYNIWTQNVDKRTVPFRTMKKLMEK